MNTGEDWKKDRFKSRKLCVLRKLLFRHHGAIKLTQNRVCFNNFLGVPSFITHKYHSKVFERLHLLQCLSTHLQKTLAWAS